MESEGIATTQISLIREHTEKIRPPRALWVSFPLGRPLGKANDAVFQKEVLLCALRLLEREEGPILVDYPYDADEGGGEEPAACPISFATAPPPQGEMDVLLCRFRDEILAMISWYDLAKEKSGRTTTGISGMDAEGIATLLVDFVRNGRAESPVEGQSLAATLTRASEDLLGYYLEAACAQPGQATHPGVLSDWFWRETCAARMLDEVRRKCLQTDDKALRLVGKLLLIPRNQMHRFEGRATGR